MALNSITIESLKSVLIDHLENNILKFWVTKTIDTENGGFIGLVNDRNNPVPNASKGVVLNTRILWTFSTAGIFFNSGEYKVLAKRAYNYLCDYFLDKKNGGVFWELDFKGNPINGRKQVYAQAFAIYSFTEYFKLTNQQEVLDKAITIFHLIEKYSHDKNRGGYIDAFGENWLAIDDLRLSEKDLNAPKTMNTHLHILEAYTNLYRVWKNDELKNSLGNLIKLFIEKFVDQRRHLVLFFDNDWNRMEDFCSFGHDIEFSWLLTEAAKVLENPELIKQSGSVALKIASVVRNEGLAKDGGLMNEYNYTEDELDSDKHWWQQAEAMVGFYNAYQLNGDKNFLDSMFSVWKFIDEKIIDHQFGEWFWKIDSEGKLYPGMEKAGFWKCPYHNSRAIFELVERMKE